FANSEGCTMTLRRRQRYRIKSAMTYCGRRPQKRHRAFLRKAIAQAQNSDGGLQRILRKPIAQVWPTASCPDVPAQSWVASMGAALPTGRPKFRFGDACCMLVAARGPS